MRLSVEKTDPGYSRKAKTASVYLDGEKVRDCITADEESGEVVVLKRDAAGRLIRGGDRIKTETRRGVVKIKVGGS